jgi:hypothetical protein
MLSGADGAGAVSLKETRESVGLFCFPLL